MFIIFPLLDYPDDKNSFKIKGDHLKLLNYIENYITNTNTNINTMDEFLENKQDIDYFYHILDVIYGIKEKYKDHEIVIKEAGNENIGLYIKKSYLICIITKHL
jgi:hypothetical protein